MAQKAAWMEGGWVVLMAAEAMTAGAVAWMVEEVERVEASSVALRAAAEAGAVAAVIVAAVAMATLTEAAVVAMIVAAVAMADLPADEGEAAPTVAQAVGCAVVHPERAEATVAELAMGMPAEGTWEAVAALAEAATAAVAAWAEAAAVMASEMAVAMEVAMGAAPAAKGWSSSPGCKRNH